MVKKYLIRIVGALCILGAVALMFMPGWIGLGGVERREMRNTRSDLEGVCSAVTDNFVYMLEEDEDFKDELKDYDLPFTRTGIKSRFREVEKISNDLLDDSVSLQEVLVLSVKAPGLLKDANNLLESDCAEVFFESVAEYLLFEGSQAIDPYENLEPGEEYDRQGDIDFAAEELETAAQDTVDSMSGISVAFILLAIALILIILLAVASAVTHICNKGRWLKYLFLALLVILVAGSCVALPMVSEMLAESFDAAADAATGQQSPLADITLGITATPFFAVALMIVPVVLDIIFERKKDKTLVEG